MIITYLLVVSNPVVNNELVEPCKGNCSETEINGSIILTILFCDLSMAMGDRWRMCSN
jgi:hypothetical protein